jgi:hypothetical protein
MGREKKKLTLVKVDKTELTIPQREPLRDRAYLDWGWLLPCSICGLVGESVFHHFKFDRRGGTGYRESDDRTAPLCQGHHTVGTDAVHNFNGHESEWWNYFGIDADLLAAWLRESYLMDPKDIEHAAHVIEQCRPRGGI